MFYYNFVDLCNKIKKSPSAVAEEMGYQRSVVTRWSNGTTPRQATLQRVADYFGLRIKGSSMEPRMQEGDIVIVRRQETADTGDTVVVLVNGDSATVKKIKFGPSGITLIPTNPSYDPMFYSAEEVESLPVRVIGRVVELRAKY